MKFTIDRSVLDEALKTVQFALLTRPSLPILNNVKISTDDGNVTFLLTDLEIAISCTAEADIEAEGETTVPSRTLISIIKRLPERPVTFSLEDEEFVVINSNDIRYRIQGISSSEFPNAFTKPDEKQFAVDKTIIRRMVICTSFATGKDPSRPIISGPLLQVGENSLVCAATDGKRLARIIEDINCGCSGSCVIPPKTNNALMKLMAGDGQAEICFNEKSVHLEFLNEYEQPTIISSKLIDGRYPNYQAIIPSSFETEISVSREQFHEAVKRISLILSDSDHGVKLVFNNGTLKMHAYTDDDESHEELDIDWSGEEKVIAFNPLFLMDPLKRLECENISLKFNDSRSAASISDDENFLYILMPMRM